MTCNMSKRQYRKWPGVKAAAGHLGVAYGHLLMVLKGQRRSKSLSARYAELVKSRGQNAAGGRKNTANEEM